MKKKMIGNKFLISQWQQVLLLVLYSIQILFCNCKLVRYDKVNNNLVFVPTSYFGSKHMCG